jgi:hypothetical protein
MVKKFLSMAFAFIGIACCVTGCATSPALENEVRRVAGNDLLFVSAIRYADAARQADPVIQVNFGAEPVRLIVDTGASPTILTQTYANKLGTVSGRNLDSGKIGQIQAELGDEKKWSGQLPYVVVQAIPEFDADGIGGLLSPYGLGPNAVVVLDFPHRLVWAIRDGPMVEKALDAIYASRSEKLVIASIPSSFGAPVPVAFPGKPPVTVDLDTGASRSRLCDDYIGREARRERTGRTKSFTGIVETLESAMQQELMLGNLLLPPIDIMVDEKPSQVEGIELCGRLGMDVLRSFVVVLHPTADGRAADGRITFYRVAVP